MGSKKTKQTFGEMVRSLRGERGISLRTFADKVNISPAYLSRLERDIFPPPAREKVEKIVKMLDCDCGKLMELAGYAARDCTELLAAFREVSIERDNFKAYIEDALAVLNWGGEQSVEFLMNKALVAECILRGKMTSADLRKQGFDLEKMRSEPQVTTGNLAACYAKTLEELKQINARRNDAVKIIEQKRARITELEQKLKEVSDER